MLIRDHMLVGDDDVPVRFRESPNWTHGAFLAPSYLVMHYTAGRSAESSVAHFLQPQARASAHLVIARDGSITQLVRFDRIAWHAGQSRWEGHVGLNRLSIGIELDNAGRLTRVGAGRWATWYGDLAPEDDVIQAVHRNDPLGTPLSGWLRYPAAQMAAALAAGAALVETYRLRDVIGHDDIAPGRKSDPGPAFPMASVRAQLFGRADDEPAAWVTTDTLNIRATPGPDGMRLAGGPLPPGTRVERVDTRGAWWLVDVLDVVNDQPDLEGWVHSRFLRPAA